MPVLTWSGSLHQTFRLVGKQSRTLLPFLKSDGLTPDQILNKLPYDEARAQGSRAKVDRRPDARRYRDAKQVYQTIGLLYEREDGILKVTDLGKATLRWTHLINANNSLILAKHAAYALSACQLRNPSGAGRKYGEEMSVFPFQFIWRAMLALDGKISSDELNRSIFRIQNEGELRIAISKISAARFSGHVEDLGEEVITGEGKNDRIIPWISMASFGWTLFPDKRGGDDTNFYRLPIRTGSIVREAAQIQHKHRNFDSLESYVEYISRSACLPKDLR